MIKIPDLINVEKIHCTNFCMAITSDFNCYVWGGNLPFNWYPKPYQIVEFENWVISGSIGDNFIILMDLD